MLTDLWEDFVLVDINYGDGNVVGRVWSWRRRFWAFFFFFFFFDRAVLAKPGVTGGVIELKWLKNEWLIVERGSMMETQKVGQNLNLLILRKKNSKFRSIIFWKLKNVFKNCPKCYKFNITHMTALSDLFSKALPCDFNFLPVLHIIPTVFVPGMKTRTFWTNCFLGPTPQYWLLYRWLHSSMWFNDPILNALLSTQVIWVWK